MRLRAALGAAALVAAACTAGSEGNELRPKTVQPTPPDTGVVFHPQPVRIVTEPAPDPLTSACTLPLEQLRRIRRGYFPRRSPDVFVVPREPNYQGGWLTMSHSGPWEYLQHVPLVFYGPGFIRPGATVPARPEVTLADVTPTLAELLGVRAPPDLAGRAMDEVLLPESRRNGRPKLILVVVWDGGGYNVLNAWPDAWPNLKRMANRGAAAAHATVGSSPSVTPSIHSTLGTGVWPKQHGIISIPIRVHSKMTGSFHNKSAKFLMRPTLADVYDVATGNQAKVGMIAYKVWHLGMIGHGAEYPGGDNDIAIIVDQQENFVTNPSIYSAPGYLGKVPGLGAAIKKVDLDDGELDRTWMGHEEILDDPSARRDTPAWVLYQTALIKALIKREGFGADDVPDLFYTNYKHIDEAGHNWNMINPEMRETVKYSDAALADLIQYLDAEVGKNSWVMVVTADHGQGPDALASGAWPIFVGEVTKDVAEHFGVEKDELFADTSPVGFWLRSEVMEEAGITEEDVARFLLDYRLEDNAGGKRPPSAYEPRLREPIFSAAFPSNWTGRAWRCAEK